MKAKLVYKHQAGKHSQKTHGRRGGGGGSGGTPTTAQATAQRMSEAVGGGMVRQSNGGYSFSVGKSRHGKVTRELSKAGFEQSGNSEELGNKTVRWNYSNASGAVAAITSNEGSSLFSVWIKD